MKEPLYLVYHEYVLKYRETQRKYDEILSEKELLFQRTQPQGISYDKERVQTSAANSSFDAYLIRKEQTQIEERLAEAKSILEDRLELMKSKLDELRRSNETEDRIYVYRYVDRMRIKRVAKRVGYSESQIYRILGKIEKAIAERCEKMRVFQC